MILGDVAVETVEAWASDSLGFSSSFSFGGEAFFEESFVRIFAWFEAATGFGDDLL